MITSNPKCTSLAVFSALYVVACSGKTMHDVGDVNTHTVGGGGAGSTDGAAGAPAPSRAGSTSSSSTAGDSSSIGISGAPSGIDGTWRGYIENYKNSDLTDTVEVRISRGGLAGEVVFGEAAAPPPATDPEANYPPSSSMGGFPSYTYPTGGVQAGFVFTVMSPVFTEARVQFDVATNELYQSWCSLQTPYNDNIAGADLYNCLPPWASGSGLEGCYQVDPKTMKQVTRGCMQLSLCNAAGDCACTKSGCTETLRASVHFDLTVTVPKADGSVAGLGEGLHNVHLTKQ